jgi:hypothetical protein
MPIFNTIVSNNGGVVGATNTAANIPGGTTRYANTTTISFPAAISTMDVLVVGAGGSGFSNIGAGGGAGGVILRPGLSNPGSPITITIGAGAPFSRGEDTTFGALLTAKGGGFGFQLAPNGWQSTAPDGGAGGSGGGAGFTVPTGGVAIQPTQPGDSGLYGYGSAGGLNPANNTSAGGGGAGSAGGVGLGGSPIDVSPLFGAGPQSYYPPFGSQFAGGGGGNPGGSGGGAGAGNGNPGRHVPAQPNPGAANTGSAGSDGGTGGSGLVLVKTPTVQRLGGVRTLEEVYQAKLTGNWI